MIEPVVSAVIGDVDVFNAKVKFSAIVVSAVLAYIGIILSQWRTRLRENKAHLLSKYEEIVTDVITLMQIRFRISQLINKLKTTSELLSESFDADAPTLKPKVVGSITHEASSKMDALTSEANDLSAKVDMLLLIYAPTVMDMYLDKTSVGIITFRGLRELMGAPDKATDEVDEWKEGDKKLGEIKMHVSLLAGDLI